MNIFGIRKKEYENFDVRRLEVGAIATNCYLAENKKTGEALIIDPGDEAARIAAQLEADGMTPRAILLTHGHFDHILAMPALRERYQVPVYCHEKESALLEDASQNGSALWPEFGGPQVFRADRTFREGDTLDLAGISLKVLHTPGHTEGSCCFYAEAYQTLFSGDTLFHGSYGRTDLPGGSDAELVASVKRLLTELPEDTAVLPGHGARTFIAFERRYNPLAVFL